MTIPDWSQIQSFVAVAENGSLSAAARARQSSQPTLSRHIAQLETTLGARLFDRSRGGMALTRAGTELLEHAGQMADAAARMSMLGTATNLGGTVRVTASQVVATFTLPPILAALRQAHPDISVELVASDSTENLLRREADIAVRMYRPTQNDVIARHVGDLPIGAYASHAYIARRGIPDTVEAFRSHDIIGYDCSTLIIEGMAKVGVHVTPDFFAFRCDDQVVSWQMVRAGCGIGFGQVPVGDNDPDVARILRDTPIASLPIWLTAHPELRSTPRIRRVYDWLADALAKPGKKKAGP
ncbi:LysR family transcriptional regulator [uncultured Tateyamaria sp.]|uniref:LysR family transcriptional regulator n=1 Tax=uncultured Tateyamaria sp. TaxID=455651 RepID=UPI0026278F5F|nr:LysR family transcriptional regulator [uncultured Tateyamaria sp.]